MPHFILDCSESVLVSQDEEFIIEQVHQVAHATALFQEGDIKVRLNPYQKYSVGNNKDDFIHVFAHVMQGRSTEQKAALSKQVVAKLAALFPHITNIAMNVSEFEKATYYKRDMLD